ncbi:S9 family peptidase [Aquipseudomonas alcaligenes]|nr:prolyl oligopeptidase family serine peptidase [Pseudomonas alcaligenes]
MGSHDALEPSWSASQAAAAARDFAELHAAHGGLLWVEFDPVQARCALLWWHVGQRRELTPPGFSVRSKVYEYGGGACCPTATGVAFVNEADQQVYHLELAPGSSPQALGGRPGCRYGDLAFVAAWQALLAVEESREEGAVLHRIVRLGLDGRRRVLVEGADFYAAPTVDAQARRLVWIEWQRPHLPWTTTRLYQRQFDGQDWGRSECLAGSAGGESLQQPRFDAQGRLWVISDRQGWWQPWLCEPGASSPLMPPHDHAPAPWQLGGRSFLALESGGLLASRSEQGDAVLVEYLPDGGERRLAGEFRRFRALAADAGHFYCIAGSPQRLPAVLAIARDSGQVQVLAGGEEPLAPAQLSLPAAFSYPSGAGETAHGYFYAAQGGEPNPPLLVFLHGGPTSACYPVFDARIPFWTQRGFAVADLNYRGSSGFGRAYRLRLQESWGQIEVEDIRAAIAHLAAAGHIDPARVFVRGASAGGYSALCALARLPGLRGGASLYGVSDPLALRRVTHKFEADYLDWLLGDPQRHPARYRERTPLQQAGRIRVPVIFFQGGRDAVVVPQQTEAMVAALRDNGVAVEYCLFADEGHGFRQAVHLAEALQREWHFYCALLAST